MASEAMGLDSKPRSPALRAISSIGMSLSRDMVSSELLSSKSSSIPSLCSCFEPSDSGAEMCMAGPPSAEFSISPRSNSMPCSRRKSTGMAAPVTLGVGWASDWKSHCTGLAFSWLLLEMEPLLSRRSFSFIGSREAFDWFDCAMPARYARWMSSFSRSVSVESLNRSGGGALAPRPGCGGLGRFSLFSVESRTCGAPGPRLASLLRPLFLLVALFARSRMAASVPTVLVSVSIESVGGADDAAFCSPTVVSCPVLVTVMAPGLPTIGGTGGTVIGDELPSGSRLSGPVVPSAARRARSSAMADFGTHSVSSSSALRPRRAFEPFAAPSTRCASASRSALSAACTLAAASCASFSAVRCCAFWRRRVAEFHRFFTAFSDRPGSSLAILVHELPHLD
mmetsp:Transcript_5938/g.10052  ORF Transcript_5938/g.10052 Transcript_5938/m.10052 type:complete len:396 (-) Transcript_5938:68-1255(-)